MMNMPRSVSPTNNQEALKISPMLTSCAAALTANITYPNGGVIVPSVMFKRNNSQNQTGSTKRFQDRQVDRHHDQHQAELIDEHAENERQGHQIKNITHRLTSNDVTTSVSADVAPVNASSCNMTAP